MRSVVRVLALLLIGIGHAQAQPYPTKPVTLIIFAEQAVYAEAVKAAGLRKKEQ